MTDMTTNYICWNRYFDFKSAMACLVRKTTKDGKRRAVRVEKVSGGKLFSVVEVG